MDAETDQGTVIPADAVALVSSGKQLQLLIPAGDGEDEIDDIVIYLTACFVRWDDEDFRQEMISFFTNLRSS